MLETVLNPDSLKKLSDINTHNTFLKSSTPIVGESTLSKLVNELPEKEKQILRNKFWLNKNMDEISKQMKIKRDQVEIVLANALSTLRQKMIQKLLLIEEAK